MVTGAMAANTYNNKLIAAAEEMAEGNGDDGNSKIANNKLKIPYADAQHKWFQMQTCTSRGRGPVALI